MMKNLIKTLVLMFLGSQFALAQYNPPSEISNLLDKLRGLGDLPGAAGSNKETYAVNITTWQMPTGGWFKKYEDKYKNPWNGSDKLSDQYNGSQPVGTFDNDATIAEMRFLAEQYKASSNSSNQSLFKKSVEKGVDYILMYQFSTGGWPQMYPKRVGVEYSNMGTYNDNAMIRLMVLVKDVVDKRAPFDTDIVSDSKRASLLASLEKGIEYILKTQIINGGKKTVWCQQHHPTTYKPVSARAYELESKSGSESVGILYFLMNWPNQTAEIQDAVRSGIAWYKKTVTPDMKWSAPNFVSSPGATLWYRYYNVDNDTHFFSDRDGGKYYNIEEVSDERRNRYQWGGSYGSTLLSVASKYNPPTVGSSSSGTSSSSEAPSSSSVLSSSSEVVLICAGNACQSVLEAENFCNAEGVFEDKNNGYSDLGYLNFDNVLNSSGKFIFNSPQNQTLTMNIFYANGGTIPRNMSMKVNGLEVASEVAFPVTNGWLDWQAVQVPLTLSSGLNAVEFNSLTSEGGPNFDAFGFAEAGISYGSCDEVTAMKKVNLARVNPLNGSLENGIYFVNNELKGNYELIFHSISGEIALQFQASGKTQFNVTSLPKGTYLVECRQNQKRFGVQVLHKWLD